METHIYSIKITGEDGIVLHVYQEAPIDSEEELVDFLWQEYYEFQSDKSLYTVKNLSIDNKNFNLSNKFYTNRIHFHLAIKAIDYVKEFS